MSEDRQIDILNKIIKEQAGPELGPVNEKFLNEAFYTISEQGTSEISIDLELAIMIWKLVELNHTWSDDQIQRYTKEIRM